jgi:hypothetical protein
MRGSGNAYQAVLDGSWQPEVGAKRERDRPSRNLHQIRCPGFFLLDVNILPHFIGL